MNIILVAFSMLRCLYIYSFFHMQVYLYYIYILRVELCYNCFMCCRCATDSVSLIRCTCVFRSFPFPAGRFPGWCFPFKKYYSLLSPPIPVPIANDIDMPSVLSLPSPTILIIRIFTIIGMFLYHFVSSDIRHT